MLNLKNVSPQNCGTYGRLQLKLMKQYGTLHNIPTILVYYRIHENQVTDSLTNEETIETHGRIISDIFRLDMSFSLTNLKN